MASVHDRMPEDLKLKNDSRRGVIHIRDGKRARDRYVMLSPVLLTALREYWKMAFRQAHHLPGGQLQAMRAIESCRTQVLGGHLDVCPEPACDFERPAYNSCRSRHCPKCQSLAQARWVNQRIERILPSHHFHVVFTLPALLEIHSNLGPSVTGCGGG